MDAIVVERVSKHFRIFRGREDTLKGAFARFFRSRVHPEEFWALQDVSFSVAQGETFGIIGENGSGKSTLLKLLCGILRPDQGSININGRVAGLLELGAGFHPDLTGRENIYLNGSLLGFSKSQIDRRFGEIVSFAELEGFIDTPIKHYSSGMYVRLGFAIAVNVDPDVLLIDEVLAVGDESFQHKCYERLQDFKRRGKTFVLVTHDLGAVEKFCTQAMLLRDGRVVTSGPSRKAVDIYRGHVAEKEEGALAEATPKVEEIASNRWGTQEVEIVGVSFHDANGEVRHRFKTGESIVIRIAYKAKVQIEDPVFGIAIHRSDGVHVTGINTALDGLCFAPLQGEGLVECQLENASLNVGSYLLSAATHDREERRAYDYHDRQYPFEVASNGGPTFSGLLSIAHRWRLS